MMHGHSGMHGRHGHSMKDGFGPHGHGKVLGTATVGERGQVVIPAEAREALGIEGGDKFVVFGNKRGNSVTFVKADVISKFAEIFMNKSEKFEAMAQEIMDQLGDDEPDDAEPQTPTTSDTSPAEETPEVG